jgi:FMN phosphatase YigB (HAD superfamily)
MPERKEKIKQQKVLFVDFNGVISYDPFWKSMTDLKHPLHAYYEQIEELLFRGENKIEGLIDDWMLGKHTSEDVHHIIADRLKAPYQEIFNVFCEDCKHLDISKPILQGIQALRKDYYCILRTDNMDTLHRFTLPANPHLAKAFDEVHSSYLLHQMKKTDGGKYFITTVSDLGVEMKNCVFIDDGKSNIALFESIGGKGYRTQNEAKVVAVLEKLTS